MTDSTSAGPATPRLWNRRTAWAGLVLPGLVGLGDFLLFRTDRGLGTALFGAALLVAILLLDAAALRRRTTWLLVVVALAALLPLVESGTLLGLVTLQGGLTLLVLGLSGNLPKLEGWPGAFMRFGLAAPFRLVVDVLSVSAEAGQRRAGGRLVRRLLAWIVPLACAGIFVLLFAAANPLLDAALQAIRLDALLRFLNPDRLLSWLLLALCVWPFLVPQMLRWRVRAERQGPLRPKPESLLFGRAAICNSLLLFNALFAVQTGMDLLFLWGGVRLPDGMSFAGYAHRGAYPLIVTALLAAAFVLAAMRKGGPGKASPLIRNLVYLWIAQNVWLVISSILRLSLYVESYHLTELRLAAGVWMGLVAVGLVLIVLRIALGKSNAWLVAGNLAAAAVTLWGFALLDLPALISDYNVRHAYEVAGPGQERLDLGYMRRLGPGTIPALDRFITTARWATPEQVDAATALRGELARAVAAGGDWRGWTWRGQRLAGYLAAQPFAPPPDAG